MTMLTLTSCRPLMSYMLDDLDFTPIYDNEEKIYFSAVNWEQKIGGAFRKNGVKEYSHYDIVSYEKASGKLTHEMDLLSENPEIYLSHKNYKNNAYLQSPIFHLKDNEYINVATKERVSLDIECYNNNDLSTNDCSFLDSRTMIHYEGVENDSITGFRLYDYVNQTDILKYEFDKPIVTDSECHSFDAKAYYDINTNQIFSSIYSYSADEICNSETELNVLNFYTIDLNNNMVTTNVKKNIKDNYRSSDIDLSSYDGTYFYSIDNTDGYWTDSYIYDSQLNIVDQVDSANFEFDGEARKIKNLVGDYWYYVEYDEYKFISFDDSFDSAIIHYELHRETSNEHLEYIVFKNNFAFTISTKMNPLQVLRPFTTLSI